MDKQTILDEIRHTAAANGGRALGHVPTCREIKLRRRSDPTVPSDQTFEAHFGRRKDLISKMHAYCLDHPEHHDVLKILDDAHIRPTLDLARAGAPEAHVYLLRSGRFYKIGHTNSVGRRMRELSIQLPESAVTVHTIATDDPQGVEAYWHRRFADRRMNGEFFALAANDVRAFKRWRRI